MNNLYKGLEILGNDSKDINQSQGIVFCQTKRECDQLARSNEMNSVSTDVLHGDLLQRKREQVLQVRQKMSSFCFEKIFVNVRFVSW